MCIRDSTNAGTSGAITLGGTLTTTVNTLLQNTATAGIVSIGAGNTLATTGIMIASGKEALTIGTAANAGTLMAASAGGALYLSNNNAGKNLTVYAVIADNATASGLITAGNVVLGGANTYTGATSVNAGTLKLGQGGALAATAVGFLLSGL